MKHHSLKILVIVSIMLVVQYCTEPISEIIPITISGTVVDQRDNSPIEDAIVRLFSPDSEKIDQTDALGEFLFTLGVDSTMDLEVIINKEGFLTDTINALAIPERDISLSTIYLRTPDDGSGDGGDTTYVPIPGVAGPSNIVLASVSTSVITVNGSGGEDNAIINFQVIDSTGIPVGEGVEVNFSIGSNPGGGEYVSPATGITDISGFVTANLVSGTISGVVQIIASINLSSSTIRSQAVAITVHGGLPDKAHFSVAPKTLNFTGWDHWGSSVEITAYVGDRYGNYCTPGTAVYFTTDGGIITGSGTTKNGTCTVFLVGAKPQPTHPTLGPGFATIIARTANDNNETIADSTIVLFSGTAGIHDVNPLSFNIPANGSQVITYRVSDSNGNPLAAGAKIEVQITGGGLTGDTNITFTDQQSNGPGITEFSITVSDNTPTVVNSAQVTIAVNGANGSATAVISGIIN